MNSRNKKDSDTFSVAIVGGGLVGSLAAVVLGKRGWKVDVYELRKDPRNEKSFNGRSINLALSVRGIEALKYAGIADGILSTLIPMKGRMIHSRDGNLSQQLYGLFGECINSVDRKFMNEHLLTCAEKLPNVRLHFEMAIQNCDFDLKTIKFKKSDGSITTVNADLIFGCDGAYSKVRSQIMRVNMMNFSQEYIESAYLELNIPPNNMGEYAMDPHHLHIWPRQTFMMIALPNTDKSFTVTLFMPWSKFNSITDKESLLNFFKETFPDAVNLIGIDLLVNDYFKNTKGSLVTVKCNPYHYKDRCVIIGDAAHAMVPFYGQGMNCAFEDVLVMDEIFTKHIGSPDSLRKPTVSQMEASLLEYSNTRNPDAESICDLAMYNYVEMRSSVVKPGYLFRKRVEGWLHKIFPKSVIPLYTMVSFSRIPYHEVMRRWKQQTYWFDVARIVGNFSMVSLVAVAAVCMVRKLKG